MSVPQSDSARPGVDAAGRWTRRGVLALMGAGAAHVLWTTQRTPSTPPGRVRLRYWEKWTGREGAAVQALVDRFNASQDRIWVERLAVSDVFSKAMVAIGGGDPPDVVGLFSWNVPVFAEAGALLPLDGFASSEWLLDGHYAPGIERLLTHGDRLWCGVNSCYTLALYANRAHLAEVGLDAPPATIEELDEVAFELVRRDARGQLERAGFLQNVPLWWPYVWPLLFGDELWDPGTGRFTFDSERCRRAFEWISRTAERHGRADSNAFGRGYERSMLSAGDPFLSGGVSMTVQGPWMASFARDFRPDLEYAVAPFPVPAADLDPERPRGMLECDVVAIPRGCPHPEEAFEFVAFLQSQAAQEELARAHGKPSPLARVSAGFATGHPNAYVHVHDAVAKSPRVAVLPETRAWKPFSDLTVAAFDAIWMGADVETELDAVQARAQAIADLQAERRARRLEG